MLGRSFEIWLALVMLALSCLAVFVWVPFDSETPSIYTFRRQTYIGDAMLPMVAAAGLAICAAIHAVVSWRRRPDDADAPFDWLTGTFFVVFVAAMAVSFLLMFWAGPIALALFGPAGDEPVTYRQMRSTLPWKWIGFSLGGFVMVFSVTSFIEGRLQARRAVTALFAVAVLILIFDVPFDTILLPPNGDF